MHFNKTKHDIRARLSIAKMLSSSDTFSQPALLESDKPRLVYQPPRLTRLEEYDIESGNANVPENNNGLLEAS